MHHCIIPVFTEMCQAPLPNCCHQVHRAAQEATESPLKDWIVILPVRVFVQKHFPKAKLWKKRQSGHLLRVQWMTAVVMMYQMRMPLDRELLSQLQTCPYPSGLEYTSKPHSLYKSTSPVIFLAKLQLLRFLCFPCQPFNCLSALQSAFEMHGQYQKLFFGWS